MADASTRSVPRSFDGAGRPKVALGPQAYGFASAIHGLCLGSRAPAADMAVGHSDPRPLMEVPLKTVLVTLASASLLAAPLPVFAQSHHGGGGSAGHGASSGGGRHGAGGFGRGTASGHAAGGRGGGSHISGGQAGGNRHGGGYRVAGRGYGDGHGRDRRSYSSHRGYGGYPYYYGGGFGLGFALSRSSGYPSYYSTPYYGYYDTPYYGLYESRTVVVDQQYLDPRTYDTAPVRGPPADACGSWAWDEAAAVYNWIPCQDGFTDLAPR